ncbi:hypothetical protein HMPREF9056_00156 [Actinomyces sp. oral taxon 170 str. F0386]|nr:hypothetical protein HMPREF9056_00156 [Actinomyces sp. oral taxon 170 str. F0386]
MDSSTCLPIAPPATSLREADDAHGVTMGDSSRARRVSPARGKRRDLRGCDL